MYALEVAAAAQLGERRREWVCTIDFHVAVGSQQEYRRVRQVACQVHQEIKCAACVLGAAEALIERLGAGPEVVLNRARASLRAHQLLRS